MEPSIGDFETWCVCVYTVQSCVHVNLCAFPDFQLGFENAAGVILVWKHFSVDDVKLSDLETVTACPLIRHVLITQYDPFTSPNF